jgi:signal recognition particle subunit SRP54
MASMMDSMDGMDPDKDIKRVRAMIQSMTLDERQNPDRIDRSRRNRIAQGSGTDPADVHDLLKQFKGMSGFMQQMSGKSKVDQIRAIQGMQQDMLNPGGMQRKKERSKRGPTDRNEIRDKKKQQRKQAKEQRKKNKRR